MGMSLSFFAHGESVVYGQTTWTGALSPVPEPSTLILSSLGLAGIGLNAFRRRKK